MLPLPRKLASLYGRLRLPLKRSHEYRRLRAALRKRTPPLMVIVTASGRVDLSIPMFASIEAPAIDGSAWSWAGCSHPGVRYGER